MSRSRTRLWTGAVSLGVLVLCVVVAVAPPAGGRSGRDFDPDRLAELEVSMWQAYYRKEKISLARLLLVALREQFHYNWSKAAVAGYHLAKAAVLFGDAEGGYERALPDLEAAYGIAQSWMGARFDPGVVARDELAWWVARRTPEQRDPANVGKLIARLYADFYEVPSEEVAAAGLLRARAADLRDQGGAAADWPEISRILHDSYRSLHHALHVPSSR